jgi:hypothetical protein
MCECPGGVLGRNHNSNVEGLFSRSIDGKEIKMKKIMLPVLIAIILMVSVTFTASAQV